ncbi:hypothetical protein GIB67_004901 [Kingdonia uniflora]|uniref:AAA+ ATPase At3g28540-like C-terminal domain-containing protein n=1 Tax=Kingdonia uniflora TaxID=39325 RepID=A0A7J7LNV5_9MAGN|nr:hypothetical protein GIB67_004901 [Kingdonia uniflora]
MLNNIPLLKGFLPKYVKNVTTYHAVGDALRILLSVHNYTTITPQDERFVIPQPYPPFHSLRKDLEAQSPLAHPGVLMENPPGRIAFPGTMERFFSKLPSKLGYDFKEERFAQLYQSAIGFPDTRRLLLATSNQSILVLEVIDYNLELENREKGRKDDYENEVSRVLASNYLGIQDHPLFKEFEDRIKEVKTTPAEIAGELMKADDDTEIALQSLITFLNQKKVKRDEDITGDKKDETHHLKNQEKSKQDDHNADSEVEH